MKNVIIVLVVTVVVGVVGCREVTVGYLNTEFAEYGPDSLVVKQVLDPGDPADQKRMEQEMPWQSAGVEGIQGTFPMYYRIAGVYGGTGEALPVEIAGQFHVAGKGKIEIGWDHTLPVGVYQIDLEVSNEGYTRVIGKIFRVIVE